MSERSYVAIDLKSFYASVECVERGLDPLTTNLVVADASRTEKTICLAVSPSLKAYGIPGRARLFEVVQKVREVNRAKKPGEPELTYLVATPRMALYLKYSTDIYQIYLKYIAPEDIHIYSIDEVFMDVTTYLKTYRMTAQELAGKMIREVLAQTGITATAGIGTNLYLCKVAMDIVAKHAPADENGVRMASLDEMSYRRLLWNHKPLTDFWRVGKGYARRLEGVGLFTMGDIARCSIGKETEFYNEDLLYRLFGINAELLIDHAWGWEPTTIADVKGYQPENNSVSSGQVLSCPYPFEKARIVTKEMAELMALDLVAKKLVTDQLVLTVGYDVENMKNAATDGGYQGEIVADYYGRLVPKHAHGTENLKEFSSSAKEISEAVLAIFDRVLDPTLLVRRINVAANHVIAESEAEKKEKYEQLDLFHDFSLGSDATKQEEKEKERLQREKKMQQAILGLQKRYGKNAVLKGTDLEEGATTRERNGQIGGHKA
ncbi:MAG: DNA methylase [Lachnospiraceae bacterium]|nr:DNA methylase [Lachnospiraceae bacterium]